MNEDLKRGQRRILRAVNHRSSLMVPSTTRLLRAVTIVLRKFGTADPVSGHQTPCSICVRTSFTRTRPLASSRIANGVVRPNAPTGLSIHRRALSLSPKTFDALARMAATFFSNSVVAGLVLAFDGGVGCALERLPPPCPEDAAACASPSGLVPRFATARRVLLSFTAIALIVLEPEKLGTARTFPRILPAKELQTKRSQRSEHAPDSGGAARPGKKPALPASRYLPCLFATAGAGCPNFNASMGTLG